MLQELLEIQNQVDSSNHPQGFNNFQDQNIPIDFQDLNLGLKDIQQDGDLLGLGEIRVQGIKTIRQEESQKKHKRGDTLNMLDQIIAETKKKQQQSQMQQNRLSDNESDYGSITRPASFDLDSLLQNPKQQANKPSTFLDLTKLKLNKEKEQDSNFFLRQDLISKVKPPSSRKKSGISVNNTSFDTQIWRDQVIKAKLDNLEVDEEGTIEVITKNPKEKTQIEQQMDQERKQFLRGGGSPNSNNKNKQVYYQQQDYKIDLQMLKKEGQQLFQQFNPAIREKVYAILTYEQNISGALDYKKALSPYNILMQDLILYQLGDSLQMHVNIMSDYEISKSQKVFTKMLVKQPRCHEALFGLGKNSFYFLDFQKAREHFNEAVKIKKDGTYIVWLGFNYLFQSKQLTNLLKTQQQNKDKLQASHLREKALSESLKYLGSNSLSQIINNLQLGMSKKKEEGLYANFGLLALSFEAFSCKVKLSRLREPEEYANRIKKTDQYMGYIAWALIYIKFKKEKLQLGLDVLFELIDTYRNRPHAYIVLWAYFFKEVKDYAQALDIAEKLFIWATDYSSFQEKLMITLIYAKTLIATQDYVKVFTLLQLEFSKSPHYTSLLYLYGKYVILSPQAEFYGSGLGALEECLRSSLPHRHLKAKYYMGKGYENMEKKVKAYRYYKQYMEGINLREASKLKKENIESFMKKIDKALFEKITEIQESIASLKQSQSQDSDSVVKTLKDQNLFYLYQKLRDYDPEEAEQFKALFQNKVFNEQNEADLTFQLILKNYPQSIEANLDYLKFLKKVGNFKAATSLSQIIFDKIESHPVYSEQVPTTLWVNCHLEIAKLEHQNQRMEEAIRVLLKIRQVLPPIDTQQICDFKMPFKIDKYHQNPLSEKAQNQFSHDDDSLRFNKEDMALYKQKQLDVIEENDEDLTKSQVNPYFNSFKGAKSSNKDSQSLASPVQKYLPVVTYENLELEEEEEEAKQVHQSVISTNLNQDEANILEQIDEEEDLNKAETPPKQSTFSRNTRFSRMVVNPPTTEPRRQESFQSPSAVSVQQSNNLHLKKNSSQIMFFTNLLDNSQQSEFFNNILAQQKSTISFQKNHKSSHRSSLPKVAMLKFKKDHQTESAFPMTDESLNIRNQTEVKEAFQEYMKDTSFSVYSNPKFLYVLGKICARTDHMVFADLAMQSFHDYLLIITYYKDFMRSEDYEKVKVKTYLWIAKILFKAEEYEDCQRIINEIYPICLEKRNELGELFDLTESILSQLMLQKEVFQSKNLIIDYF